MTGDVSESEVARFEAARPRLEAIAYRLLGSAGDAEDLVQETFLRWQAADRERIEVPEAWWTRVLTNLCLNQLDSARTRRETYVGTWLPEPLLAGDPMLGPADTAVQRDSVSYAVMVLLERLSPAERAVYVLREAFDHSHAEIAGIIGVSESASQQLLHRARKHLGSRPRVTIDDETARRISEAFLAAATSGRTEPLVRLLTADAVTVGDGGGKVPARASAVVGAVEVATFLQRLMVPAPSKRKLAGAGSATLHATVVNGGPALLVVVDGRVFGTVALEVSADQAVRAVFNQVNPDKLRRATERWSRTGHVDTGVAIPL